LAGILAENEGVDVDAAKCMIEAQRHRGPDAQGVTSPDKVFAASHARLTIVDLSDAGNQPFEDGKRVLVFNGEIYNHAALRPELEKLGARFRGSSDTATLFEALRLWGVDETLRRIRGMFAFAYYDVAKKTVSLCRDRLGIKPLHYTRRAGNLYFASEIKGIAAAIPLEIDPFRAMFSIASVGDDSHEKTAFKRVRQVPPGAVLECRAGGEPTIRYYYQVSDDVDESLYRELDGSSETAVADRFNELLAKAVSSMLMSDAPLGVFVSGGLDSSVLAALASKALPSLPLFSSNVEGRMSEIGDARALAAAIQCPLYESRFTSENFLDRWARATWHHEVPIVRHMSAVPLSCVSALARQHNIKCVLTGEGADELLLGYPKDVTQRYDKLARRPVDTLLSLYGRVPGLREHLWPETKEHPDHFLNLLAQGYLRQQLRETGLQKLGFLDEETARAHYATMQLLQEQLHSLLHRNDRMGMISSIEARFPFLDEELVRFAINLPVKYKIHASLRLHNYKHPFLEDKWLLRRLAREHLPKQLANKRKNGFPVPGYNEFVVSPKFFHGGFVEDILELNRTTLEYVTRKVRPMFVARLAAVDIFGRMFAHGWSPDRATAHAREHIRIAGSVTADLRAQA
jgi:asparagine synthase (glutamine-hydrolysing)